MTPADLLGIIKDTRDLDLLYPRNLVLLELLDGPLAPAVIRDRLAFAPPRIYAILYRLQAEGAITTKGAAKLTPSMRARLTKALPGGHHPVLKAFRLAWVRRVLNEQLPVMLALHGVEPIKLERHGVEPMGVPYMWVSETTGAQPNTTLRALKRLVSLGRVYRIGNAYSLAPSGWFAVKDILE